MKKPNHTDGKEKSVTAHAYVPGFPAIKARKIHAWAIHAWAKSENKARRLLPVLLRKLIHSTGHELRRVDFPGYDNAERQGWDGQLEADAATTPWIPKGKSGWEFSTSQGVSRKANDDYAARLRSVALAERREYTFVFVTPRNWRGKNDWAKSKNAAGEWKDVRAFDASDLEQWLEESIPTQMWLAEQLAMPISGFETLDQCWQRWEGASKPKMVPEIFEPSVTAYRDPFKNWLENASEKPFVVAADSRDEALAFLSCLFRDDRIAPRWKDLAIVFQSAETLRTLADSSSPFIPIVHTEEVERELTTVCPRFHCIVVRPRNAVDSKPDIALDLLEHKTFENALAAMGIRGDRVERLARESGRSPTILRRRLSRIDAVRKPQWAGDAEIARRLIPMILIGAWRVRFTADSTADCDTSDCEILSTLADRRYKLVEESVAYFLQFDDSPVWATGQYRGVVSKIDALFAVKKHVLAQDLTEFFWLAEYVLSESDPALELPEDQRWAAGLYGKVRAHSAALREGICETLVILSVHGNALFQERLGIDVEACVSGLIRKLLTPLSLDKLLSQNKDLPHYAEAAPEEFLMLLEDDLRQPHPVALGLLKPAESGPFGSPTRTRLLWALECLAWKHLGRASLILAQLSKTLINDNWLNKPISSLHAIYCSRLPQTAASLEERIRALQMLKERFPDIAWQICVDQISRIPGIGIYNYRPRWRSDASGAGLSVVSREFSIFRRHALNLVLTWPRYDQKKLSDLLERVTGLLDEDQTAVWDLIDAWTDSETDETAKACLREQIRQSVLTSDVNGITKDRGAMTYEKLQPCDLVIRYAWLFDKEWVDLPMENLQDTNFDYSKREEKVKKRRLTAMQEIWETHGFEGVTRLLSRGDGSHVAGRSLEPCIKGARARGELLQQSLSLTGDVERKINGFLEGFLLSCTDEVCATLLAAVADNVETDKIVRLFCCAPFRQGTWRLLEQYGKEIQDKYWREVPPLWGNYTETELTEIVDRLLEAKRPRAAFRTVHWHWGQVETVRLKRILFDVATLDDEPSNHYGLDHHNISRAFTSLNARSGISPNEMAQLEFIFLSDLEHTQYGIPNLDRIMAESPEFFLQVLSLAYRRNDGRQDPPDWPIREPEDRDELACKAFRLFDRIRYIPGTAPDGKVNPEALHRWMTEVRRLCAEHGRAEVGDKQIGQLLSKSPAEEDGGWPCLPVCKAMETIASRYIGEGFQIGVYNGRGVVSRAIDEGGDQERELAAKYRGWAKLRAFAYPYVSSILESIAASYDQYGKQEDNKRAVEKRLRN